MSWKQNCLEYFQQFSLLCSWSYASECRLFCIQIQNVTSALTLEEIPQRPVVRLYLKVVIIKGWNEAKNSIMAFRSLKGKQHRAIVQLNGVVLVFCRWSHGTYWLFYCQTLHNKPAAAFLKLLISKNEGATETFIFLCCSLSGFMQRQFCVNVQLCPLWKSWKISPYLL